MALAVVLWVVAAVGALVLVSLREARDMVATAENRTALLRASWRAEECAERARAAADAALSAEVTSGGVGAAWRVLDSVVARAPELARAAGCAIELRPTGVAVDVTSADAAQLRRVLAALGVDATVADSLADAVLDWQDADDTPRPAGAEGAWYEAASRRRPPNALIADVKELRRVRGFDALPPAVLDSLHTALTVEPGRLALAYVLPAALASLPGMTPEVTALVQEMQRSGVLLDPRIGSTPAVALDLLVGDGRLSPATRDAVARSRPALISQLGVEPEGWILLARGFGVDGDTGRLAAVVELRLTRAGARTAIMRRRQGL